MKNTNRLRLIASMILFTIFIGYGAALLAVAAPQALSEAVRKCDLKSTQKYIKEGVDLNALDGSGRPPLINAVDVDCQSIVKLLLDSGAKIDGVDNQGRTPLHYAAAKSNADLLQLLLSKDSNINSQD